MSSARINRMWGNALHTSRHSLTLAPYLEFINNFFSHKERKVAQFIIETSHAMETFLCISDDLTRSCTLDEEEN